MDDKGDKYIYIVKTASQNKNEKGGETPKPIKSFCSEAKIIMVVVSWDVLTIHSGEVSSSYRQDLIFRASHVSPGLEALPYNLYFIFRCYAVIKCKKGIYKKL